MMSYIITRKGGYVMLKIKKIKDASVAMVMAQADSQPCKYAGVTGAYNCLYDCKVTSSQPYRYYKSKEY